jgi:glycerate 2-kinase
MTSPIERSGLPPAARAIVEQLIAAALQSVDPYEAVRAALHRVDNSLLVNGQAYDLDTIRRIVVVGAGKAGAPMAAGVSAVLADRINAGWVNVNEGHTLKDASDPDWIGRVRIHQARHPLPDAAGEQGANQILALLQGLGVDDLAICIISGGGSALLPLPAEGVSLAEKQAITDMLLASGATINELNAVRKHISAIKGGQLAQAAYPAAVITLILSDVVGSPLDVIASGPTVPDHSTFQDAWQVLEKFRLADAAPAGVRERLLRGRAGELPDTPKPGDPIFAAVENVVVADNAIAGEAVVARAQELGLHAQLLTTFVEGEAREVGRVIAGLAKEMLTNGRPARPPACLVLGGETTVTLRGDGAGGRNQELALSAALALEEWSGAFVVALATDGTDGPTDAAGAVIAGDTTARARGLGLRPLDFLERNDSYHFFAALGDLILTGPTNTNVNDLTLVLAF